MIQVIPIDAVLQLRQQVLWPDKDLEFVRTPNDDRGIHLGIFIEGEWVSCISLFIEENQHAVFRKFATLPDFQNKGYGSQLLQYSFNYLQQQGVHSISCSARVEKQSFYEKFGMEAKLEPYFKNGLKYVTMEVNLE
ncbi:MAG: GNAT family N-acetyltransferase [Flavobacterium sp.]|nr:GNAT family N-acetyltransferase [Flavobacterium sp.]